MKNQINDQHIFVQAAIMGSIPELNKVSGFKQIKIYNISYENIEVTESTISRTTKKNSYFIAALIELIDEDNVVHNIIAEDVFVIQNSKKIVATFYDNYTYMTKEIIYEEYQEMIRKFKQDTTSKHDSKKITSMYLRSYRKEVADGYKDLFNFYKLKNREFNQNTLENARYMKIRKKLSRNILREMLISKIIMEYRNKKILT